MKALVLSGGKGTRLRPFSHAMAKQLAPVAGTPVLLHCLENIRDIGVTEVAIIVGDTAGEIMRLLGDGSALGLRLTYIHQDAPRGLADCVAIAEDFLGDDDFVMYLGDNVLTEGIGDAAREFRENRPDAQILVTKVPDPSSYGIVELAGDGSVRAMVEKPDEPRSDLAIIGVYFLTASIHAAVRAIRPGRRGELEITDALQHLLDHGGDVTAGEYTGYWQDIGSVDNLLDANRVMLDRLSPDVQGKVDAESSLRRTVVVEPGAEVTRSRLEGPVLIGAGAVVTDSRVGPNTALVHDCVVEDSELEDSILMEGSRIDGIHGLRNSIIGRRAEVTARAGTRLVIGDHSRAEVAG